MKLDRIMTEYRTHDWEVDILIGPVISYANRWDRRLLRWFRGEEIWKNESDIRDVLQKRINSLKKDGWI